jgi:hypothetical protein
MEPVQQGHKNKRKKKLYIPADDSDNKTECGCTSNQLFICLCVVIYAIFGAIVYFASTFIEF